MSPLPFVALLVAVLAMALHGAIDQKRHDVLRRLLVLVAWVGTYFFVSGVVARVLVVLSI